MKALSAAAQSDKLVGTDNNDVFSVTGDGSGTVNGTFSYSSFEELDGGAGLDRLSYTGFSTPVIIDLETGSATGVDSFTGFEGFLGGDSSEDEIRGTSAGSTFTVNNENSGSVDGFIFGAFENLLGREGE